MMNYMKLSLVLLAYAALIAGDPSCAAETADDETYRPHTPTLIYYLSAVADQTDADTIVRSVKKLPSVRKADVNIGRAYVQVRFDSHVVSYHQVGQAIADAGAVVGKKFEPRLRIRIAEYSQGENAAKVDAVLAGKRLNQRVRIEPLDKAKGEFLVYLLPLEIDSATTGPQGFNGGHLNHPLHDPPPRGLGLTCTYLANDDGAPVVTIPPTR
jgi:copper chaperone CopZ